MNGHHLTLGAHLLLWVFPLVLVLALVADGVLGGRRSSRSS